MPVLREGPALERRDEGPARRDGKAVEVGDAGGAAVPGQAAPARHHHALGDASELGGARRCRLAPERGCAVKAGRLQLEVEEAREEVAVRPHVLVRERAQDGDRRALLAEGVARGPGQGHAVRDGRREERRAHVGREGEAQGDRNQAEIAEDVRGEGHPVALDLVRGVRGEPEQHEREEHEPLAGPRCAPDEGEREQQEGLRIEGGEVRAVLVAP